MKPLPHERKIMTAVILLTGVTPAVISGDWAVALWSGACQTAFMWAWRLEDMLRDA